jgi:hypothetical protein
MKIKKVLTATALAFTLGMSSVTFVGATSVDNSEPTQNLETIGDTIVSDDFPIEYNVEAKEAIP